MYLQKNRLCAILKTELLTWQKLRRWDWGSLGIQFSHQKTGENCQKNTITGYSVYSVNSAIRSRTDRILFHSFRNQNRSQKNTITANSVYSHFGIVPKECALTDWEVRIEKNVAHILECMVLALRIWYRSYIYALRIEITFTTYLKLLLSLGLRAGALTCTFMLRLSSNYAII